MSKITFTLLAVLSPINNYQSYTKLDSCLTDYELANTIEEYQYVFGEKNIHFLISITSPEELKLAKQKALANLFGTLNGPIHTVVNQIKNK